MRIVSIMLFLIAISAPAQSRAQDSGLPSDVTDLIIRRTSCYEWSARRQRDPALASNLTSVFAALRCNDVPRDEAALRRRYLDNSGVLAALNAKWAKVVRRVPVQIGQSPQR